MSAADGNGRRPDAYEVVPQDDAADVAARYGDEEEAEALVGGAASLPPPTTPSIRRVHYMLGAAVLLPWNAMITASAYFSTRLARSGSSHASRFSFTLNITLTLSNLVFLLHATLTSKRSPITRRLRTSGLLITVLFVLFALSTALPDVPPNPFFFVVLTAGAIQSAAGSYMNASVFALGALFGPLTLQAAMAGQAAAGVLVSVVQLGTTYSAIRPGPGSGPGGALTPAEERADADASARAAFWFFAFSVLYMLASLAGHAYVGRQHAFRRVLEPFEDGQRALSEGTKGGLGLGRAELAQIGRVTKANAIFNGTVAFVFSVTLSVYPAITGSVAPHTPTTEPSLSHPALFVGTHFILFNVGDWLGRYACSYSQLVIHNPRTILALAFARILFVPAFLSCNVGGRGGAPDFVFFGLVLFLGGTGGWLGSLCMMGAADPEHNHRLKGREEVDTAATIAGFCLVGGLALGSLASAGVSALL